MFTKLCHLSLSWARPIQSMSPFLPPSCFLKICFHIVLRAARRFSKWSLSLKFPHQNSCMLLCPICATCFAHRNLILITQIIVWAEYRSSSSLICSFLQSHFTSSLLGPNISSAPCFQTLTASLPPLMWEMKSRTLRNWRQRYSYVYCNLYVVGELVGIQKILFQKVACIPRVQFTINFIVNAILIC